MTWSDTSSTAAPAGRQTYFFLSYAHSVPLSAAVRPDTDFWVNRFFQDLGAAVRRTARRTGELDVGFFDGLVDPGADLKRALTDALSVTHVFVPLYSPKYFSNPWALGERDSFHSRLRGLPPGRAARHVLPVLWLPLSPWEERPETAQALELARNPADRADYAENGLRALCKLSAYRRQYESVLAALAERVVAVAESDPLAPSRATTPASSTVVDGGDTPLVITTVTPHGARWRPYGDQHALAVADYVAATAERLGLPTRVVEIAEARARAPESPTVVLVDASVDPDDARAAVDALPRWAVPLVIAPDGARGDSTPETIAGSLQDARFPQVLPVREIVEFERSAPQLVIEARKLFLRHGPVDPPDGPAVPRPSLRPDGPSDAPRGKEDR
ncbi:TIR-like protein FxsC [Micromonospora citrea]|uniref:TIR-like protein FxsC n=1 Tax=Micromonospora citrea TaxID=47855 RepID=UPI003C435D9E